MLNETRSPLGPGVGGGSLLTGPRHRTRGLARLYCSPPWTTAEAQTDQFTGPSGWEEVKEEGRVQEVQEDKEDQGEKDQGEEVQEAQVEM